MLEELVVGHEKSTMIELFECLPLIEHRTIWSDITQLWVDFSCCFDQNSLNLEKIELEIDIEHYLSNEIDYDPDVYEEYHSDVWLEHLIELKIIYFSNLEPELKGSRVGDVKNTLARPTRVCGRNRCCFDHLSFSRIKVEIYDCNLEFLYCYLFFYIYFWNSLDV
ncbi:hypothetical protein HanPI659440_Chr08g0293551 [Helianthus annuus]|nr:hypothetical protein HanPI659440_Chr08g0293551 [Helianthus annuus]